MWTAFFECVAVGKRSRTIAVEELPHSLTLKCAFHVFIMAWGRSEGLVIGLLAWSPGFI